MTTTISTTPQNESNVLTEQKWEHIYEELPLWQVVLSFLDIETVTEIHGSLYFQQKHKNSALLRTIFINNLPILINQERQNYYQDWNDDIFENVLD